MKKRIMVIVLTLMMVFSFAACGSKKESDTKSAGTSTEAGDSNEESVEKTEIETLTWNGLKFLKVSVDVPKDKGYELIEGRSEKAPFEMDVDFTLVGEKFIIEFYDTSYVYQTSIAWKDLYGETDPNFEDFKKATTEKINGMTGAVKQVNGEDVVIKYVESLDLSKYIGLTRYYNTDGMREDGINTQFCARFYTLDESIEDVDILLEDEEVKAIFDSIKIEKK